MGQQEKGSGVEVAPARISGSFAILLALAVWPAVLGRFVSLEWMDGDLRTPCTVVSFVLFAAGVLSWARPEAVSRAWRRRFPTRRILAFTCVAIVVWTGIGLGFSEVAMRLVGVPFTRHRAPPEMAVGRFDPDLGWSYVPDRSTAIEFGDAHRKVTLNFNTIGSRVPSPGTEHDPQAPTLILVGGSFTMGHGVEYEESLAGQLESIPGLNLQVVNLGVQAYGTDQSLIMLRRHLDAFDTRAVVYGFICDHVKRNSVADRHLLRPNLRYVATKPMFDLDSDGVLHQVAVPQRFDDLKYLRLTAVVRVLWARHGPKPTLDVTRALVAEMRDVSTSRGAAFVVANWVFKPPEDYCGDEPFAGMGLNMINTASGAPPNWSEWTIPGDGHPQPHAYTRVASLIADELRRLGVVPPVVSPANRR